MSCPLCQNTSHKVLKGYKGIGKYDDRSDLCQCTACGHHYLIVNEKGSDRSYFEDGKYQLLDTRKSIFDRVKRWDANRVLKVLDRKYEKGGNLLDFGCGKGLFLSFLKDRKWLGKGIETAEARANLGRKLYEVDIDTELYESGKIAGGPFKVITLFHVLEHLAYPKELISAIVEDNLQKEGTLVVEVPLFSSWQSLIARRLWIQLDPPLHVSHFDKPQLTDFLKALGLKIYRIETFSLQLGVLGMVQSLFSLFGYRGDYIEDLKFNRTHKLLLATAVVLPFAFMLELLAALFQKGGVIRLYASSN